jgi:hypothetical protein
VARIDIPLDLDHGRLDGTVTTPVSTISCVGYGNGYFWVSNWSGMPPYVHKIDHSTGASLDSFAAPSDWPCGIAWDGASLWICDFLSEMSICKVDPDDGSVLSSFPVAYSYYPGGLAWDGEYLYHGSYHVGSLGRDGRDGDGLIHKYMSDGTHVGSFGCPRGSVVPHGIAFDGENLWVAVADADTLYVVDRDDGEVLRTVPVSSGTGHLAVDDSHIWIARGTNDLERIVP